LKLLDDYLELQKQIYNYFGYKEDWVVIPIDDRRNYYWTISYNLKNIKNRYNWGIYYCESKKIMKDLVDCDFEWERNNISGSFYSDEIYTQRFLKKWAYRGKDFTMICVDTHTDGNKFLAIYSNEKEVK